MKKALILPLVTMLGLGATFSTLANNTIDFSNVQIPPETKKNLPHYPQWNIGVLTKPTSGHYPLSTDGIALPDLPNLPKWRQTVVDDGTAGYTDVVGLFIQDTTNVKTAPGCQVNIKDHPNYHMEVYGTLEAPAGSSQPTIQNMTCKVTDGK